MTPKSAAATSPGFALPERVEPVPDRFGLDTPYWEAARDGRLAVQWCAACARWQWGPEWVCFGCQSFGVVWREVPRVDGEYRATVCSWVRVWHPTDAALRDSVPYVVVLVELAAAGVKMIGNLLGDQRADVVAGMPVQASFEHHERYSLVHWERI